MSRVRQLLAIAPLLCCACTAADATITHPDGGNDAGRDAGSPRDAGSDTGLDAGVPRDAGSDAGSDAGPDAGLRACPVDGGIDGAGVCTPWTLGSWDNPCTNGYTRVRSCQSGYDCRVSDQ